MMILRSALTLFLASSATAFFVARPSAVVPRQHPFVSSRQVSLSEPNAETEIQTGEASSEIAEETNTEVEASSDEEPAAPFVKPERHTIYVGNLPYSTSVESVKELFNEHVNVLMVSIPTNEDTGNIKGFAFVDVETEDQIPIAVDALNGCETLGRPLRVSKVLPKDQIRSVRNSAPEGSKLFVGNLSFDASSDDIKEYFSGFGEITDVFMPVNPNGDPRGFAFVSVKEEDLDAIMEATNGSEFLGRTLTVNLPLPPGEKAQKKKRPGTAERSDRTKLYVGNLSFYTDENTLAEVFEEFGEVYDCYIPQNPDRGTSRGFGFITIDKEAAVDAIDALNGCELDGRMINVNEAQSKGRE